MTAWRFKYRKPGQWGWFVPLALTSYHTEAGAQELINRWNRKDRGQWEWEFEICLPSDIDHPDQPDAITKPRELFIL